ncbi:MAG: hydrogenase iron-sulfur subunit, partial [Xanthomonadales bacterium]|nr:hydrogenase iron-sulfur subunit [Xanthomonadales bacterium]
CPTATPFRRHTDLVAGIEQPELTSAVLRERIMEAAQSLSGDGRILVFGCAQDPEWRRQKRDVADHSTATVDIYCMGHLPPSFIDFVLSRNLADGVVLAGCPGGNCQFRFGAEWTSMRMAGERDPRLRKRVDVARLALAWQAPWSGMKRVSTIVDRLWYALLGQEPEDHADGSKPRKWKWVLVALAYAAFLAPVAVFSIWPRYPLIDAGRSMVSMSFSYAGERVGECRQLTQDELNELPPNMRRPVECPRGRLPVRVLLTADGQPLYDATLQPAGLWNDGAVNVYRRIPVEAGTRELFIGVNARGEAQEFHHQLARTLDLEPGQHVVVEFDDVGQSFFVRTE